MLHSFTITTSSTSQREKPSNLKSSKVTSVKFSKLCAIKPLDYCEKDYTFNKKKNQLKNEKDKTTFIVLFDVSNTRICWR